jgi:hypothetical protein
MPSRFMKYSKEKVLRFPLFSLLACLMLWKVPSQAEIRLKLTEDENKSTLRPGSISWLVAGINVEDEQLVPALCNNFSL